MATPKSWTATDLEQGKLTIIRTGADLHLERRYDFLDSGDVIIPEIAGGRVVEDMAIASLPASIIDALQTIDNWTYQKALVQEGMND